MNLLDAVRFNANKRDVTRAEAISAEAAKVSTVKVVTSIAAAIEGRHEIAHQRAIYSAFDKIRNNTISATRDKKQTIQLINKAEQNAMKSLGEFLTKQFIKGALRVIGRSVLRGVSLAVRLGLGAINLVGRLALTAARFLFSGPIGWAALAGTIAYAGYKYYQQKEEEKTEARLEEKIGRMDRQEREYKEANKQEEADALKRLEREEKIRSDAAAKREAAYKRAAEDIQRDKQKEAQKPAPAKQAEQKQAPAAPAAAPAKQAPAAAPAAPAPAKQAPSAPPAPAKQAPAPKAAEIPKVESVKQAGDPVKGKKSVKVQPNVDLSGMDSMLMTKFYAMADEYHSLTGKTIQINSAFRSKEKQAELAAAYPHKAAPAGYSMHEYGLAIDINSADANALVSMGLFEKYGFVRPVKGEAWHVEPTTNKDKKAARAATPGQAPVKAEAPKKSVVTKAKELLGVDKKKYQDMIVKALIDAGVTDSTAIANVLSQVQYESGFNPRSEELQRYTAKNLFKMYGPGSGNKVRFQTLEAAEALVKQGPEAVGELIYGGRMGNKAPGEGFKYRGRGFLQVTGKGNYTALGKASGMDLVGNPDLANDPVHSAKHVADYFLKVRTDVIKTKADLEDINKVNKAVGFADKDKASARAATASSIHASLDKEYVRDGNRITAISRG